MVVLKDNLFSASTIYELCSEVAKITDVKRVREEPSMRQRKNCQFHFASMIIINT